MTTTLVPFRRAFLRQLAALPLLGGGLTLGGEPTAVAEPVTLDLLEAYKTWLHYEHHSVSREMAEHPHIVAYYGVTENLATSESVAISTSLGSPATTTTLTERTRPQGEPR